MNKNVKFISRALEISRKIDGVIEDSIKKMALNSQRSVMLSFTRNFTGENRPIDSGQLRQSIKQKVLSGNEAEIYSNKHYAPHVEFGTVKMKARPYFRKGMADAEEKNRNILKYALRTKIK